MLYNNIQAGKLDEMTASLSTYFMSICKNKALEHLRGSARSLNIDSEMSLTLMDGEVESEKLRHCLHSTMETKPLRIRKKNW